MNQRRRRRITTQACPTCEGDGAFQRLTFHIATCPTCEPGITSRGRKGGLARVETAGKNGSMSMSAAGRLGGLKGRLPTIDLSQSEGGVTTNYIFSKESGG